jgi:ankyrin repeat protein
MVDLLINHGASIEARNDYGRTPLLLVARESGNAEIAAALIGAGARVEAADRSDATALELAAWRGFGAVVDVLLDHGASLPASNDRVARVTTYAVRRGLDRLFRLLAAHGADLDLPNENGGSLLHAAAEGGSVAMVEVLLDRDLDINRPDRYGRTPLHYAAERNRAAVTRVLVARGADVSVRDLSGSTPLSEAERVGAGEVVTVLRAAGAEATAALPLLRGPFLGQPLPDDAPVPFALGIVASHRFEHGTVTFASDGDLAVWETAYPAADSGYALGTIVQSRLDGGRWTPPEPAPFSEPSLQDDVPIFHPDGRRLFFVSARPDAEGRVSGERIWWVDRSGDGWGAPMLVDGGPNTMGLHWQFSVAADGSIYFSSGDPGGQGDGDIYVSRFIEGRYEIPRNLGPPLNTDADETQPYIAPDESYLLLGRPGEHGSLDLWVSFRTASGGWSPAVNLGPTINSSAPDICPIVSPDGRLLFFNSRRNGNADNFWVRTDVIDALRQAAGAGGGNVR